MLASPRARPWSHSLGRRPVTVRSRAIAARSAASASSFCITGSFADIDVFDLEVGSEKAEDMIRFCELLDPAAELDQPGADRRIGDALQIARDQLVGQPESRRDGAQVVSFLAATACSFVSKRATLHCDAYAAVSVCATHPKFES